MRVGERWNKINVPIWLLLYLILVWVFPATLKLTSIFLAQPPYPLEAWFIPKSKPTYQMFRSCLKLEFSSRLFVWAQFMSEVGLHYSFINLDKSAAGADTRRNKGKRPEWWFPSIIHQQWTSYSSSVFFAIFLNSFKLNNFLLQI